MSIKKIPSLAELRELINSGKPIVIDFFATWCGPCRMIAPRFESLANANPTVHTPNFTYCLWFYSLCVCVCACLDHVCQGRCGPATRYFLLHGNHGNAHVRCLPQWAPSQYDPRGRPICPRQPRQECPVKNGYSWGHWRAVVINLL